MPGSACVYIFGWWETYVCALASDRHISCFFLSFFFHIITLQSCKWTLPKMTQLSQTDCNISSLWNRRKTNKNKKKSSDAKSFLYMCLLWFPGPGFNPVNVPQSGCGCLLPLCHWALSARICRAVTFPGPHSNGLQSGSVGQCAVCVCVFVEGCTFVLINGDVMSSGIWEMDGCTVGNEPNGALFFFCWKNWGPPRTKEFQNYLTYIPWKKTKTKEHKKKPLRACAYHVTSSTSCSISWRPERVPGV